MTSQNTDYDFLFKVLLIGDSHVGKSSLISRFCDEKFSDSHISTIGMDLRIHHHSFNGKHSKIQLWDTAGQERFRTICTTYYRGAHAVLICFDLTSEESFKNVPYWIDQIEKFGREDVFLALIGTKCDIAHKREVDAETIEQLANQYQLQYFETSSKQNNFVEETFGQVFDRITSESMLKNDETPVVQPVFPSEPSQQPSMICPLWFK
eukprot:gene1399-12019_t